MYLAFCLCCICCIPFCAYAWYAYLFIRRFPRHRLCRYHSMISPADGRCSTLLILSILTVGFLLIVVLIIDCIFSPRYMVDGFGLQMQYQVPRLLLAFLFLLFLLIFCEYNCRDRGLLHTVMQFLNIGWDSILISTWQKQMHIIQSQFSSRIKILTVVLILIQMFLIYQIGRVIWEGQTQIRDKIQANHSHNDNISKQLTKITATKSEIGQLKNSLSGMKVTLSQLKQTEQQLMHRCTMQVIIDQKMHPICRPYLPPILPQLMFSSKLPELLYSPTLQKERIQYHRNRTNHFNSYKFENILRFSQFNMRVEGDQWSYQLVSRVFNPQYDRLREKWASSQFQQTERQMCIVVPSYNNNVDFRIQYNLNSIFAQNYTNFRVIIVDDASTDGTASTINKYLSLHNIPPSKAILLQMKKRRTALPNIHTAITDHCPDGSFVIIMDGDDELIGRNAFKSINWAYSFGGMHINQHQNYVRDTSNDEYDLGWSSLLWYGVKTGKIQPGPNNAYTDEEKIGNKYRSVTQKFSQLRTFSKQIYLQIDPKSLTDPSTNEFYTITYDFAMFFPMLQLSCGANFWLSNEYQYLYKVQTGQNDYQTDQIRQISIGEQIRKFPSYDCMPKYY